MGSITFADLASVLFTAFKMSLPKCRSASMTLASKSNCFKGF